MKLDRLIGIITILLQNNKTTAPQLAKRFEVSRRTINRDIEDICKAPKIYHDDHLKIKRYGSIWRLVSPFS